MMIRPIDGILGSGMTFELVARLSADKPGPRLRANSPSAAGRKVGAGYGVPNPMSTARASRAGRVVAGVQMDLFANQVEAATGPADEARARRKGRAQPGLDLSIEHIGTVRMQKREI